MGKSKAKKGSKFSKMSEEERARYLQYRATIEEETRRRKEQLIETFMKNKLKREQAFSRLNAAKVNQQWRHTLRILKCVELKQDMEALYHWFENTANRKTKLIENLLDDLEEAESQYCRLHRSHLETLDGFTSLFELRVNNLHNLFLEDRNKILLKSRKHVSELNAKGDTGKEHLQAILICMEKTAEDAETCVIKAHTLTIEEMRTECQTRLENFINTKESKMEEIWKNFYRVLEQYRSQTESRRQEYLNLRAADLENSQQILQNNRQINSLNDVLQSLKTQQLLSYNEKDGKLLELKVQKNECTELFNLLRKTLTEEKQLASKKIIFMNKKADQATNGLKAICEKGKEILKLINLCGKLERQYEKTVPFRSQLTDDEEKDLRENLQLFNHSMAQDIFEKYSMLDGFQKKVHHILIEKESLQFNCEMLAQEQKKLKKSLKRSLSEFTTRRSMIKNPLTIYRPIASAPINRRSISLSGHKIARSGKANYCNSHSATERGHMITIQLNEIPLQ